MLVFVIPGALREFSAGRADVRVEGAAATTREALALLWKECPGARGDWDVQLVWELQNLGLGNRARQRERRTEHQAALIEAFQIGRAHV